MTARNPDQRDPDPDGPSKSQRKRDAVELKELGDELVSLPSAELDVLPLSEKLRDAIDLAKQITARGGAARQRQFIGKLLRKGDVAELKGAIARRTLEQRLAAREFHRIEAWRDRLVVEGAPALAALLAAEPRLDADELRALVATAQAEAAAGQPPAAARALFRWLRVALAAREPTA
ncbi:MAG TPA: ribosome biogenesis factor YjgA [Steroidobacteraceae bacterium]|nr:ribosome biogenesis factor YjgA [Steroidobacteraceae bacterium]